MTPLCSLGSLVICGVALGCEGPSTPSVVDLLAEGTVSMTFTPQDRKFADAAEAYRRLWAGEGSKIVDAMERVSGLTFRETHVKAVIFEGPSRSGVGDLPMYLRASYPADVKKATLVHEHGHRLMAQLRNRPPDLDEHRVLFLFLYDVWDSLWGRGFAGEQVKVESGRKGLYDYETAWKWALSMSKEERASRFAEIVQANRTPAAAQDVSVAGRPSRLEVPTSDRGASRGGPAGSTRQASRARTRRARRQS